MDKTDFEPYLTYDAEGNITGLKKDAPVELKIQFNQWFESQKAKARLGRVYHNE